MGTAEPKDPASWIDRRIGDRYVLQRCLARGSMGAVYLALHDPLGREVAVKVLDVRHGARPNDSRSDSRDRKRFLREASLLAKLTHPNTVRVFDYGHEQDTPYLVMELVKGATLQALLKGGQRLDPIRAIRVARQICGSLSEAHALGMVHRDLKPANVLITPDYDGSDLVKVVDFGLVKEMQDAVQMTGDGTMLGTPMYMSPEQIRGKSLDQRADLYSLGVVLYRMLLGRPPFVEQQTAAVLVAHITDPPPRFAEVDPTLKLPEAVEWTVQRLLAKRPEDRFSSAQDLARALKVAEAALLDPDMAASAQMDLIEGRKRLPDALRTTGVQVLDTRAIRSMHWRRAVARLVGAAVAAAALLAALVFGYVAVRGVLAFRDARVAVAPAAVEDPAPPAPTPEPEPAPTPAAAPLPEPEPAPVAAEPASPKPASPKPASPKPASPKPASPKPATAPPPAPTPPAPTGSDLADPWAPKGDTP